MSAAILTFENVAFRYRYRAGLMRFKYHDALTDISFSLGRGETVGVVGRNGAGKSTLLRLMAGILAPSSGRIRMAEPLNISLLTLHPGFSPELSGRENAVLGALMSGRSRRTALERMEDIKRFSELGDWFEKPIKSYSTGMLARLGFAVALEMSPDVLLVDEVLGVGDEAFRAKSTAAMKQKMLSGQTVVFVSHQAPILRELCSSLVWVEEGVTRMVGPTDEVLPRYQEALTQPGAR
ncbi:ABC transporter ATP-binding protein [Pseudodesulfovibrio portus]|jgi:lipopolysaccharide transport system ATP-binding protein|uniref:AAA+ ATPase domain-containing protein n=1 Tax=Pseudodesulfovibrio portus TaxID=231439 RepID=A0ABN6RXW4_9BACT|nr:ATP-binding cassette domain-containing protein [Pseudodesulfovibrio portus]BDQ34345.1 hypothetical protein JCM14722_18870 [Pseudodesulfovibrio portus]